MKKIILLLFILAFLTGCNTLSYNGHDDDPYNNTVEIREAVLNSCSPLKKAVIREELTDTVLNMKQYYKLEYRGGSLTDIDVDSCTEKLNNIAQCIGNDDVKSDLYNACDLLNYAKIHGSQQAFDNAYEIIETINAFIFSYPLTQEYFSGWLIDVNTDELNKFYDVTKTFGTEHKSIVMESAYSETEITPDNTLKDIIEKRESDINDNIQSIKNDVNSYKIFSLMHELNSKMANLRYAVENYNPDNDYCGSVKAALHDADAVNDSLIGILKNKELIDKYTQISDFVKGFDNKYGNNFTYMDIDTEITELCRMTDRLEYLYCDTPIDETHENISYLNMTEELEDSE